MRYITATPAETSPDLRGFRQSLAPRLTQREVASGAGIDKAMLSRLENGSREISPLYARRLARFYSRITGQRVTAGEILDMAELAVARHREP
jgi:transcriptional regulator with XRE-family HTH domain